MLFYYTKIVFNHPYSILYALTASLANYVSATLWHPFFLCSFILLLMMFLVFFPISWKFVKMDKFQIFFMLCSTDSLQLFMMYCGTRNTTKRLKMTFIKKSLSFNQNAKISYPRHRGQGCRDVRRGSGIIRGSGPRLDTLGTIQNVQVWLVPIIWTLCLV